MRLHYYRFDGDRQYNANNSLLYSSVLGPPRGFADSDVDLPLSPGTATVFSILFTFTSLEYYLPVFT